MTKKFLVFGRVQGVGFRYFTWQEAKNWGLKARFVTALTARWK